MIDPVLYTYIHIQTHNIYVYVSAMYYDILLSASQLY